MGLLLKHPRGYVSRATPLDLLGFGESPTVTHETRDVGGNREIGTLYKLYTARGANAGKWAFRRRVIYHCAQIFGDFKDWIRLQAVSNDNIYGLNLSFLHDTVRYIRTGSREMSVQTWLELMLEYPDADIGCANRQRFDEFKIVDVMEFDNFIGDWCSHPNGLEDMLWTAYLLFGSGKSPLLNHPLL